MQVDENSLQPPPTKKDSGKTSSGGGKKKSDKGKGKGKGKAREPDADWTELVHAGDAKQDDDDDIGAGDSVLEHRFEVSVSFSQFARVFSSFRRNEELTS